VKSDHKLNLAALAGPIAWGVQLWVLYILAEITCASVWLAVMLGVTAAAFGVTVWAFLYSRRTRRSVTTEDLVAPRPRRIRGHAGGAMMISGFFLIVIVAQALPVLLVQSCP
jgi:hypothetical protein